MIRRIPKDMLQAMTRELSPEDRDEMAIPSYLHPNPALRWMAWRRVEVIARRLRHICDAEHGEAPPVVMDFGCGTGVLFEEASRYAGCIFGVDLVLEPATLLVDQWKLEKVRLLTPEQALREIPEHSVDLILAA